MAKYQANPVVVDAFVITNVFGEVERADVRDIPAHKLVRVSVKLEDGRNLTVDDGMIARMIPVPGDYYVVQADGYVYLNPKAVFERKYSPLPQENVVKES